MDDEPARRGVRRRNHAGTGQMADAASFAGRIAERRQRIDRRVPAVPRAVLGLLGSRLRADVAAPPAPEVPTTVS